MQMAFKCHWCGMLLCCQLEGVKEGAQTNIPSCSPHCTYSHTQTNILPRRSGELAGGRGEDGMMSPLQTAKPGLEIMVTFQRRWCHFSTATSPPPFIPLPRPPHHHHHHQYRWLSRLNHSTEELAFEQEQIRHALWSHHPPPVQCVRWCCVLEYESF